MSLGPYQYMDGPCSAAEHGKYKCIGLDKYKCSWTPWGYYWLLAQKNAPECTPTGTFKLMVFSQPGGYVRVYYGAMIDMVYGGVTKTYAIKQGDKVKLEAKPYYNYEFVQWIVDGSSYKEQTIELTISKDISVEAAFRYKAAPPPECAEGSTKCERYDLYKCIRGKWVLIKRNAEECGYTPPPICHEGETRCLGTSLYICQNGQWVLKEKDSPQCGYTPPPPPACTEGATKCEGYDLYQCVGGSWKLIKKNAEECEYAPTPPPTCTEGSTQCIGTDLYRCVGGSWRLEKRNAEECGYKPPAPGFEQFMPLIVLGGVLLIGGAMIVRAVKG